MDSEKTEKEAEKAESKGHAGHAAPVSFAQKAGAGTHNALNSISKGIATKAFVLLIVGLIVGIVLGQVVLPTAGIGLISMPTATGTGNVDMDALKAKVETYLNENVLGPQGVEGKILEIKPYDNDFYTVSIEILQNGQSLAKQDIYLTKSGNAVSGTVLFLDKPIEQPAQPAGTEQPAEVQKSDKPKVELFVFSYCPYGTQAEKAIAPVVGLLGAKADFSIVQIGAMHGAHEETEAKRQACILKNYPDKFWDYLVKFDTSTEIGACNSNTACSAPLVDAIFAGLGIDKAKIDNCIPADGSTLYNSDVSYAQGLQIGSSPTVLINGTAVNVARSPEAIKQAVCSAFNTAPGECSTTLDSTATSAGFGGGTGTTTGAGCST